MIYEVFCIRDALMNDYGQPFFSPNEEVAKRSFTDLVNDEQSSVYAHPNDFDLFFVGRFNTETAEMFDNESKLVLSAVSVAGDRQ